MIILFAIRSFVLLKDPAATAKELGKVLELAENEYQVFLNPYFFLISLKYFLHTHLLLVVL